MEQLSNRALKKQKFSDQNTKSKKKRHKIAANKARRAAEEATGDVCKDEVLESTLELRQVEPDPQELTDEVKSEIPAGQLHVIPVIPPEDLLKEKVPSRPRSMEKLLERAHARGKRHAELVRDTAPIYQLDKSWVTLGKESNRVIAQATRKERTFLPKDRTPCSSTIIDSDSTTIGVYFGEHLQGEQHLFEACRDPNVTVRSDGIPPLTPSTDTHVNDDTPSGRRKHISVLTWYNNTAELTAFLAGLFEGSFPACYETYKEAFKAGRWFQVKDNGPWLNRAVVWKLDVGLHCDSGDGGPTVTFPVGFFVGGHMQIPQLGDTVFE
ncbi:uncharacterized protein BXZ73DRAFT_102190 [Epithele typhae]|uniref:uncharacterized protein n=1 Tax=Epithele typhae TaxID=378194 RepID=UPI002007831C|nr:uncharacterized protein BXZ73DRAFT_102190 [Epithele typhae]KAH9929037.1 hypothetical protein BXZ73DRAFT_102190 [Epithele typhae]